MLFNLIYNLIFLFVSIYILINAVAYALYEIREENNKSGGIVVITFAILVIIFSNIMVWTR